LQVIDFKGFVFCLHNGHPVETRLRPAFGAVKGGIIHKVIHKVCGYFKKFFKYGDLACALSSRVRLYCGDGLASCGFPLAGDTN
jgi:hypothetical protein